jgi:hypothetical protein
MGSIYSQLSVLYGASIATLVHRTRSRSHIANNTRDREELLRSCCAVESVMETLGSGRYRKTCQGLSDRLVEKRISKHLDPGTGMRLSVATCQLLREPFSRVRSSKSLQPLHK